MDFCEIQAAVDAASDGDTNFVQSDECLKNVGVNRRLTHAAQIFDFGIMSGCNSATLSD